MAYVKENKRQMREKLQALYRPYPVAINSKGEPSFRELHSRLHAQILANRVLDANAEKYRKVLSESAPSWSVEDGKFISHRDYMKMVRKFGYAMNPVSGRWAKR